MTITEEHRRKAHELIVMAYKGVKPREDVSIEAMTEYYAELIARDECANHED